MTSLSTRLSEYLDHRRRFGADMASAGESLKPFVTFADAEGTERVTRDLFLRWKAAFGSAGPNTWAIRLGAVRSFATWLQGIDGRHEIPPKGLVWRRNARPRPHIFSEEEIGRIVTAAAELPSPSGLRGATFPALFGLIAVTGLRIGEATGLDDRDLDAGDATLHVRCGKNGRSRVIPVTRCTVGELLAYQGFRRRAVGHSGDGALFQDGNGRRTSVRNAQWNFAKVGQAVGLRRPSPGKGRGPRIHDLRHTMASRTILDWFRQGRDVDEEMYRLSAYLGHVDPSGTYYYIEAVPELLALASERGLRALGDGGAS
ncbi:MAG: tyrosine-type recombinase/integrase [Rhodospirillales bacterium]|nr:tyrosine-type recombinase/integrase [Rhodospirillales bacterium]